MTCVQTKIGETETQDDVKIHTTLALYLVSPSAGSRDVVKAERHAAPQEGSLSLQPMKMEDITKKYETRVCGRTSTFRACSSLLKALCRGCCSRAPA